MDDLAGLIRTERMALIGLLETLDAEQWATQSLCDRWTVQDVAAHLAFVPVTSTPRMTVELVRSGMRVNKVIGDLAIRDSSRGVSQILAQLRENAERAAKPVGMAPPSVLTDAVVHQLDVRVPLGKPRTIPPDSFRRVASYLAGTAFPASLVVGNVRKRVAGLRLVADDVDWSHGEGPEVRGSSENLMLMLAGRPIDAGALTGDGAPELCSRL